MKSEEVKFSEEKGTDSQFVVIDTFLEKRRAKGTNRVTKVSDVSEIIAVTLRKFLCLPFFPREEPSLKREQHKDLKEL